MKWQPIETAPKDKTLVLLATPKHPVVVGWFDARRAPFPWAFVDDTDMSPTGCCDMEADDRVEVNGFPADLPTHWMPLPEPPESK